MKTIPESRYIIPVGDRIKSGYHAETADVNFVFDVDGIEVFVPVHKCILAVHSPVFRRMFYESELRESGDIKLTDTTVDAFIDFIGYLYQIKNLQVTNRLESEITPLLYLAHKYDVNWLEEYCKQILYFIMDENIAAVLWIHPLAYLYGYNELQSEYIDKIRSHGSSIIESDEFADCQKEVLKEILHVNFGNRNEVKVFLSCIEWAKRVCVKNGLDHESSENIRTQLGDCFELIRFTLMTLPQFMQCLSINAKVFTHDEIERFARTISGTIQNTEIFYETTAEISVPPHILSKSFDIFTPIRQSLFEDQTTTDVTFFFKDEKDQVTERLSAHKCILATRSKIFADLFEKTKHEVHITDASVEAFKDFLQLMYFYTPTIAF